MNLIINGGSNYLNTIKDLVSGDIAEILLGAVKGDSLSAKSGTLIKAGDIVSAELIDASVAEGGTFTGIININGSLLKSVITEDLFNEFATGKTFNGEFGIPVKLQLSSINGKSAGTSDQSFGSAETQDISGSAVNSSSEFNIVFKIVNESSAENVNTLNIQKTLDLYGKAVAENIQEKFETILNSLGTESSRISSGLSNEIQNIFQNAAQNISVSVRGNFAFIHIDFGGLSTVILTTDESNYKAKNFPHNSKKKYMFMIELNLKNLGRLKLFSYYHDKNLSIKFDGYAESFKKILSDNLELLKEMMSADGIKLNDISFKNRIFDKQSDNEHNDESIGKPISPLSANINDSNSYLFLNGKIIDERV
ncbi:MAG: flagellar hook-length control protein FliK [Candidatus Acidulodesulfobacterium sp.]